MNAVELLPEFVELLVFGVASAGLTVGGGFIEQVALSTFQSGQPALGGWFALMGLMAFYFAYLLNTDKVFPQFSTLRGRLAER